MATTNPKIVLSRSQDIPFNKLALSQANVRRVKAGITSEIIAWKLRLFVPTGASGPAILGTLMERHLLVRVADRSAA